MNIDSIPYLISFDRKLFVIAAVLFSTFIMAELIINFYYKRRSYNVYEALASLTLGFAGRLINLAELGIMVAVCFFIWNYRVADVPLTAWWGWLAVFFAYEFCYYFFHRAAHSIRWLWAFHTVHHSPEHLSIMAALRLCLGGLLAGRWLALAPLLLLGFHPVAVFTMMYVNVLYQFWIHSETIPKLGPLEYVFNTPSNHRVHHAINPEYIDQNFGGILIIYDRLFGTYVEENGEAPCRYGLTRQVKSNNPIRIALHEWIAMASDVRRSRSLTEFFGYLFAPPGWKPKPRVSNSSQEFPRSGGARPSPGLEVIGSVSSPTPPGITATTTLHRRNQPAE